MASGAQAQIVYGEESAWRTRATPNRAVPLLSESLEDSRERLESEGIVAGDRVLRSQQWNGGPIDIGGDIQHELYQSGIDLLLKHMFGTVTTTGSGPYTHVYKPGPLDGKGLTIQVGRPGVGGVVHPFDFLGCKIAEWEIGLVVDQIATLGLTVFAGDVLTDQTLVTPSYPSAGLAPFKFTHGLIEIDGDEVELDEATIKGNNALKTDRRKISRTDGGKAKEALEEGLREYTGTLKSDYLDNTQYDRFVAGEEVPISIGLLANSMSLTIDGNVRFDGAPGMVGGRELLTQDIPIKFIKPASGEAITVTTVNSTATF